MSAPNQTNNDSRSKSWNGFFRFLRSLLVAAGILLIASSFAGRLGLSFDGEKAMTGSLIGVSGSVLAVLALYIFTFLMGNNQTNASQLPLLIIAAVMFKLPIFAGAALMLRKLGNEGLAAFSICVISIYIFAGLRAAKGDIFENPNTDAA